MPGLSLPAVPSSTRMLNARSSLVLGSCGGDAGSTAGAAFKRFAGLSWRGTSTSTQKISIAGIVYSRAGGFSGSGSDLWPDGFGKAHDILGEYRIGWDDFFSAASRVFPGIDRSFEPKTAGQILARM